MALAYVTAATSEAGAAFPVADDDADAADGVGAENPESLPVDGLQGASPAYASEGGAVPPRAPRGLPVPALLPLASILAVPVLFPFLPILLVPTPVPFRRAEAEEVSAVRLTGVVGVLTESQTEAALGPPSVQDDGAEEAALLVGNDRAGPALPLVPLTTAVAIAERPLLVPTLLGDGETDVAEVLLAPVPVVRGVDKTCEAHEGSIPRPHVDAGIPSGPPLVQNAAFRGTAPDLPDEAVDSTL